MIKELENPTTAELEELAKIWLNGNLAAHDFIEKSYWHSQLANLKELLPQARLFVYYLDQNIIAFLGLQEDYIAGLFVQSEHQHSGVGQALVNQAKKLRPQLQLAVYEKNQRALNFYLKNDFVVVEKAIDENTNAEEYQLLWQKPEKEVTECL